MAKGQDKKKDIKKVAALSPKEKKAAKRDKKSSKSTPGLGVGSK